jgi:hypothetical protein
MTLKTRVAKLEAALVGDDEVTLEELVLYSYRPVSERDLEFEARLARSTLGRMIAECVRHREVKETARRHPVL